MTTPLTPSQPCALCQGTTRWQDAGVWRCVACAPEPLTVHARALEAAWQAQQNRPGFRRRTRPAKKTEGKH
jgi:hypothetical protein